MIERSLSATAQDLAAMPEDEFLELCRDCDRINSEYDFKRAGIHTLGAAAWGALSTSLFLSAAPYGAAMGALSAIPAAVCVWKGIQDVGEGVQHTAKSASADTALRVLYQNEVTPGAVVKEAESPGRVTPTMIRGVTV